MVNHFFVQNSHVCARWLESFPRLNSSMQFPDQGLYLEYVVRTLTFPGANGERASRKNMSRQCVSGS